MKKIVIIALFLLINLSLFSFPEVDRYGYYGRISFSGNRSKLGYIINQYNDNKQKIREEIYNSKGKLIKYQTFEYNESGGLVRQADFDAEQNIVREINYKTKGRALIQKVIREHNKHPIVVDIENSYYNNTLIYRIESYSYEDEDKVKHPMRQKKVVFSYRNDNEKLVERYVRESYDRVNAFRLKSAELYKYNGKGRVAGIILLDSRRKPVKYFEYNYNSVNKIRRINVYRVKGNPDYTRGFTDIDKWNFVLKQQVVYEYSDNKFENVVKLTAPLYGGPERDPMNRETASDLDNTQKVVINEVKPKELNLPDDPEMEARLKDQNFKAEEFDPDKTIESSLVKNEEDDDIQLELEEEQLKKEELELENNSSSNLKSEVRTEGKLIEE